LDFPKWLNPQKWGDVAMLQLGHILLTSSSCRTHNMGFVWKCMKMLVKLQFIHWIIVFWHFWPLFDSMGSHSNHRKKPPCPMSRHGPFFTTGLRLSHRVHHARWLLCGKSGVAATTNELRRDDRRIVRIVFFWTKGQRFHLVPLFW
jgi:hypothetical protein